MPVTRLTAVTMAACPRGTVPPWNAVYSPVAATASRYVRSCVPDVACGDARIRLWICAVILPPASIGGNSKNPPLPGDRWSRVK